MPNWYCENSPLYVHAFSNYGSATLLERCCYCWQVRFTHA